MADPSSILAMFDLSGRRALITGGGGGLGAAMVAALAGAGASVAVIGRSATAEEVADLTGGIAVRADLADASELRRGFDEAVSRLGGLDILLAAHGTNHVADAVEYDLAAWNRVVNVNLTTVFEVCQLAGAIMLDQRAGKIITVASMLSFSGGFRAVGYAASKGGIAQMTKALANEWASFGVNVNSVAPGYIQTALNEHIWRDPERNARILDRLPAGRWGEPSDLQGAVIYLASRASDYLHGAIIPVDGGWLSR
jgi:2-deoxy-D-gluconate 3-dehydrogenase